MEINNAKLIKHHKLVIKNLAQSIRALDKADEMLDQQIKIYTREKSKFQLVKCREAKKTIFKLINSLAKDINYRRRVIDTLEEEDSLKMGFFDLSEIDFELLGDENELIDEEEEGEEEETENFEL